MSSSTVPLVQNGATDGTMGDASLAAAPPVAILQIADDKPDPPPVGHSATSSPPIEVVDIVSDDEDDGFASVEPEVELLSGDPGVTQDLLLPDPSGEFPYLNNGELPSEIMMLLMGPLTQGMCCRP